jgi:hypothetical protein
MGGGTCYMMAQLRELRAADNSIASVSTKGLLITLLL